MKTNQKGSQAILYDAIYSVNSGFVFDFKTRHFGALSPQLGPQKLFGLAVLRMS